KDYFGLEKERHDDARIRLNSEFYRIETRVYVASISFFIRHYIQPSALNKQKVETVFNKTSGGSRFLFYSS
ncbi:MAG: hypothetical protein ACR2IS_14555, partial [Nitrososphaeraceae archaeon]